jgi:cytochrome b561
MNPASRYDAVSIALHWLTALLILILLGLGWYMHDLPKGPERGWFFALHKSIGLTAALVIALRIGWRLTHPAPALPAAIGGWQRRLATASHHLFYVFLVVQPVTGYLSTSFSGYATKFWGIPLPHWGRDHSALNQMFTGFHELSAWVLTILIVLHVCGVILHLRSAEQNVLPRMLPGAGARSG